MGKRYTCESCGEQKALAHYEDGNHCFACGKKTKKHSNTMFITGIPKEIEEGAICPEALNEYYSSPLFRGDKFNEEETNYLTKFGLDEFDAVKYNIIANKYYGDRLCFPIFQDNELIFAQFRDVRDKLHSKCLTFGKKPFVIFTKGYEFLLNNTKPLVIVEDPISAMVVGNVVPTFCLFGSSLSRQYLAKLAGFRNKVYLWLDPDSAGVAAARKLRNNLISFTDCTIIKSEKDPKYYNRGQILEYIK